MKTDAEHLAEFAEYCAILPTRQLDGVIAKEEEAVKRAPSDTFRKACLRIARAARQNR